MVPITPLQWTEINSAIREKYNNVRKFGKFFYEKMRANKNDSNVKNHFTVEQINTATQPLALSKKKRKRNRNKVRKQVQPNNKKWPNKT